jgi:zinc D-Ala-D-Ala carboxypeptidase
MDRYSFFSERELACKCGCGCGQDDMDEAYMAQLVFFRKAYGKPMILSSAFRCPRHNARVSSTGADGPHTTGRAVDILISGSAAHALVKLAFSLDFTGIGVRQNGPHAARFIHLDTLDGPVRPWIWTY